MSSINAPQWFKDAVRDWPVAVWYPLLTRLHHYGDQPPAPTISSSLVGFFDRVNLDTERTAASFSPHERFGRDKSNYDFGYFDMPEGWLNNGAIIIVGHAMRAGGFLPDVYNFGDSWAVGGKYCGARLSPPYPDRDKLNIEATSRYEARGYILNEYTVPPQMIDYESPIKSRLYENYSRPQYRCAVLGVSPNGDVVVGEGHPDYATSRSTQSSYVHIGQFDPSKLQYLTEVHLSHNISPEEDQSEAPLNTFVEVRIPGVVPIVFPPIEDVPQASWWRNKKHCSEGAQPVIVDKRGFPIGMIPSERTGVIPPDPV